MNRCDANSDIGIVSVLFLMEEGAGEQFKEPLDSIGGTLLKGESVQALRTFGFQHQYCVWPLPIRGGTRAISVFEKSFLIWAFDFSPRHRLAAFYAWPQHTQHPKVRHEPHQIPRCGCFSVRLNLFCWCNSRQAWSSILTKLGNACFNSIATRLSGPLAHSFLTETSIN